MSKDQRARVERWLSKNYSEYAPLNIRGAHIADLAIDQPLEAGPVTRDEEKKAGWR